MQRAANIIIPPRWWTNSSLQEKKQIKPKAAKRCHHNKLI